MSHDNNKRKVDESIIEKMYKKIKKREDHYYTLKKSTTSMTHEERGSSRKNVKMEYFESESPNIESEKQDSSCSEHELLEPHEISIDEEALQFLGDDPSSNKRKAFKIHSDLASRWKAWICSGLAKEARVDLLKRYSRDGNCPLEAPILNAELLSSINEIAVKRDEHFIDSQCLIGSAMSTFGSGITLLLNEEKKSVDRNELLKLMCDAGKLAADLHHKNSMARKAYILAGLDKRAKAILGKVETDEYLFDEDSSEKLKSAKAVEKRLLI